MNLTNHKNAAELLERAATRHDRESGIRIAYAEGDFSSNIGATQVGKKAMELFKSGRVRLFQKLMTTEPRKYQYIAEVV